MALDVDGVRMIAGIIREFLSAGTGVLLITHYPRILDYIEPDRVTVLYRGRVVAVGGLELVDRINQEGYKWVEEEIAVEARWNPRA